VFAVDTDASQEIHLLHDMEKTSTPSAAADTSVDPATDLSLEFVHLQKLLGRVATELDEQYKIQASGLAAEEGRSNVAGDAVCMTMLRYVMRSGSQSAQLDQPSQMSAYSSALRRVTNCIELLDNLTTRNHHHQLASTLMSPWNHVERLLLLAQGNASNSQMRDGLKLCRQNFAGAVKSKGDTGSGEQASAVDELFRQYMNKTLETVSQLSHTVQSTLDRVKTLPDELFAENKTAKKIGRKLTEAMSKLNSKVQSGWKHVASRFEDVRRKWFGYSESTKTCKQKKKKEEEKKQREEKNGSKFPAKHFTKSDEKVEDTKRQHKQTKSTPREYGPQYQQLEDLLQSVGQQLEGFFEGNQRSWRQYNKARRLRNIGGRIERLNEDMFVSMDDDDVEDTYEDLKDIGEDLDKHQRRDVSDELRTWMSCQLRWWKTRIHRRHRAEDLVKGCGRQLMHWQLRVLCKQQQQQQDKQQHSNTLPPPAYRHHYHPCDAVMHSEVPAFRSNQLPAYDLPPTSQDVARSADKTQDKNEKSKDGTTSKDWTESSKDWDGPVVLRNESCVDAGPEWYLRRVQDREDRRQPSPQWYFNRVEDRQYSRSDANWYVRAMRHNTDPDYPDQLPPSDADVKGGHN